jgi:hypothetical protein
MIENGFEELKAVISEYKFLASEQKFSVLSDIKNKG